MSSLGTFKSKTPRSREKKVVNPKPQILGNETLSTKTPQKSEKFSGRARNGNVAFSIGDIRRAAAKSLSESSQKRRTDQIDSWPDESPKKKRVGRSEKLQEKYEILSEFFNGLDTWIRLLRLRGLKPSFAPKSSV